MNAKINIGIVGLGRLGGLYVEYLSYQIPKANVVALVDADEKKATEMVDDFGIKHHFSDYREMLEVEDLDAVVITSPTSTHRDIVIDAAEKGLMIFCEKPLSISLDEAIEMKEAVEKNGVFFHMGFMRRFDSGYAAAKQHILDGEIGDPIVFKATSRDPERPSLEFADPKKSGGLFLDMGIHDFDLARWFMGEVSEVYSIGNRLKYPEMESINEIDNAISNITFESGTLGSVDMSRSGIYGYDIKTEILGTEGTIQIGYLRETPIYVMKKNAITHDTVPFFMERFEKSYITQLKDFVEKAVAEKEPSITIQDGERALLVGHAARASFEEKQPVVINNKEMVFESKFEIKEKVVN
ncbi:Gfo/Idh/MocA family oxidoreductase [Rhodohalobacter sulfatireducens]|uniref:Gfo/Idh/MocA family oxidoreductase n=1 Tax=Rhodohalobacter sulfatireducens TaxID=2911366 RepID=A0ABS9KJQ1_9BACT|nr:Gfo/Idh/MocA family oxidoreductase [Rhodohalobacter sulfatireducens]MCG2591080.1 Gfo/Idh/MocA family oxidoreductase [Rhodohalobacter sulfatireducens]MDR9366803.1 Gfo/Idh/MocA family oxidoreductase [Balneolaceae bacterium]MDR9408350.1 Gfo/Idh/MocA family oxidoreductase [Balneolaceae bacterium]